MGNECGIPIEVSSRLVVLGMGESPGMEGNEKKRMHDETHRVIELLRFGEGTMPALVCQNPDTGENEPLNSGVCDPGCESKVGIGKERNVGDCEVDQGGEVEVVADHICHRSKNGRFEAMGGNGIVNLLHGEGRQLEGIAMEVEMLWLL